MKYIILICGILIIFILIKIFSKDKIRKGDIRFNYKHKHLAHVKEVKGKPPNQSVVGVFLSSQTHDGKRENIKMTRPVKIKSKKNKKVKHGYFFKRVREYPYDTFSRKIPFARLTYKDKKKSDEIYLNLFKKTEKQNNFKSKKNK